MQWWWDYTLRVSLLSLNLKSRIKNMWYFISLIKLRISVNSISLKLVKLLIWHRCNIILFVSYMHNCEGEKEIRGWWGLLNFLETPGEWPHLWHIYNKNLHKEKSYNMWCTPWLKIMGYECINQGLPGDLGNVILLCTYIWIFLIFFKRVEGHCGRLTGLCHGSALM